MQANSIMCCLVKNQRCQWYNHSFVRTFGAPSKFCYVTSFLVRSFVRFIELRWLSRLGIIIRASLASSSFIQDFSAGKFCSASASKLCILQLARFVPWMRLAVGKCFLENRLVLSSECRCIVAKVWPLTICVWCSDTTAKRCVTSSERFHSLIWNFGFVQDYLSSASTSRTNLACVAKLANKLRNHRRRRRRHPIAILSRLRNLSSPPQPAQQQHKVHSNESWLFAWNWLRNHNISI